MELQAKLLQVLEEGEFYPLGAVQPVKVNVRIISSTNCDMKKMIEEGIFRRDLFYRLNIVGLEIPPLRERLSDIPLLLSYFYPSKQDY